MADSQSATGELTLSVILPNYNHGRYLPRALDALLAQNRPADEIIVVDDGSIDDSLGVIASYAAKSPSIRLLKNEANFGVIKTLARGLEAARGKYVYFGAADDFVMPGFFANALDALAAYPEAGMACGEMILTDGKSGKLLGVRPPVRPKLRGGNIGPAEFARLLRSNDNFILTGAALLRRDAAIAAGGFDARLSSFADGYLVRKIALTSGLYFSPRPYLTWNIFADSVSRSTSSNLDRAKTVFDTIKSRMATDTVFPDWYPEIFSRRWRFSLCRLAVQEDPVNLNVLMDMGVQNNIDRALLKWLLSTIGGRAARLMILAWLWLRLRPFSLTGLISTALARRAA